MTEADDMRFSESTLLGMLLLNTFGSRTVLEKTLSDACMKGERSYSCSSCCVPLHRLTSASVRVRVVLAAAVRQRHVRHLEAKPGVSLAAQLHPAAGHRRMGCEATLALVFIYF